MADNLLWERAYIGKNANAMLPKVLNSGRNASGYAFLFGSLYWIYRKLYLETIIFVIVQVVVQILCSMIVGAQISVMIARFLSPILYAILFYPLYERRMQKRLRKCKSVEEAAAAGGVNVLATVLYIFTYIAIFVGIVTIIAIKSKAPSHLLGGQAYSSSTESTMTVEDIPEVESILEQATRN